MVLGTSFAVVVDDVVVVEVTVEHPRHGQIVVLAVHLRVDLHRILSVALAVIYYSNYYDIVGEHQHFSLFFDSPVLVSYSLVPKSAHFVQWYWFHLGCIQNWNIESRSHHRH